jgi:RNA polymerase sigma-70 factor (ECF subfamily)
MTNWEAVALLYEGLVRICPTVGALVGRAAAVAEARGADAGWTLLQLIARERVVTYQPYWALSAHLLKRMRRTPEARVAYERAIGLCDDPVVRQFLISQTAVPTQS